MQVDEKSAAGTSVFSGRTYYFCSTGCRKKFDASPAAFVDAPPAAPAAAAPGATYTCPMHPEIETRTPGSCPKCGMALVPIAGSGATDDSELHDLKRRLWIGSALSAPLFLLAMAPMVGIHELFGLQPKVRGWIGTK